jgi:two-component system NtrC family sensor kinase
MTVSRFDSYRFRVPLSLTATAVFSTLVLSLVIIWHTYVNVEQDLIDHGRALGAAMVAALAPALQHDDVWMAYTVLRGSEPSTDESAATFVAIDAQGRIVASSRPFRFPVARTLADVAPAYRELTKRWADALPERFTVYRQALPGQLVLLSPIQSDGVAIGALLTVYPPGVFLPRFVAIAKQGTVSVVLILIVIVPLGWYWGKRMVRPLMRLSRCMSRISREPVGQIDCTIVEGKDEIGQLGRQFMRMMQDLRQKAALERRVVVSDRLAAVGRLAAGVAHEINNPLGGMLLSIDTLNQRGQLDDDTRRSLSLIERGLLQIQDTVSALLVEARLEQRPLSRRDIEDTRTLVQTDIQRKGARIAWTNEVSESVRLPATFVRQVIINLLLNAVEAIPEQGAIDCWFVGRTDHLAIEIGNDGDMIDPKELEHLFEPYYSTRDGGNGLGLWVTYQIVEQLQGEISVETEPGRCVFRVTLPYGGIGYESTAA